MTQESWDLIKNSKGFNITNYRRAGRILIISMGINLSLGVAIYYSYLSRPEHDFYATNGETPPVMLTALAAKNNTSVALLDADPENENEIKLIPK